VEDVASAAVTVGAIVGTVAVCASAGPGAIVGAVVGATAAIAAGGNPMQVSLAALGGAVVGPLAGNLIKSGGLAFSGTWGAGSATGLGLASVELGQGLVSGGVAVYGVMRGGQRFGHGDYEGGAGTMITSMAAAVFSATYPFPRTQSRPAHPPPTPKPSGPRLRSKVQPSERDKMQYLALPSIVM
jgi:hypothetical protein